MPDPVILDGTKFKVVHFFNQNDQGWNESYWASATGGTGQLASVYNAAVALLEIRKKALSSTAKCVGVRVGLATGTRISTLGKGSVSGTGPGLLTGQALPSGTALFIRAQDASFTYSAEHVYRGLQTAFVGEENQLADNLVATPQAIKWQQEMRAFLVSTYADQTTLGGSQVRWGIRASSKDPVTNQTWPVINVGVSTTGRLQITVPGNSSPFVIGDEVALSVNRIRCVRGVSGRHRVRNREVVAAGALLTLNSTYCCNPADLALLFGKVRMVSPVIVQYGWFFFGSLGHRNTGRPNFITAGRRNGVYC